MEWASPYLVAIVAAWAVASVIKVFIDFIKNRRISEKPIFSTGGMPSAHTAPVVALTTTVAFINGIESVVFAISFVFTVMIVIDSFHVRRAVGEQGKALEKILPKDAKRPYFALGHTPAQVAIGAVIGIFTGIITYYIMF